MNTEETPEYVDDLASIGFLLEYPSAGYGDRLSSVAATVRTRHCECAGQIDAFADETAHWTDNQREELYTATFDVSPAAVPYASVHHFGTEDFRRGELMARLLDAYGEAGIRVGTELPDHIGLLMRALPALDDTKRSEIVRYLLPRPLEKIGAELATGDNPYRHLIAAARLLMGWRTSPEDDVSQTVRLP